MRTLQTVCARATSDLQLKFWAVLMCVLWLLFSSLNVPVPAWLWFQLCRWGQGPACPVCLTAGMWAPLVCGPYSIVVSLFHWVTQALTINSSKATLHWTHHFVAVVNAALQVTLNCSPKAAIVSSCCVHPIPIKKLALADKDEVLISVWWYCSKFSADDKTSSVKEVRLHLFLYLFKTFFFFNWM